MSNIKTTILRAPSSVASLRADEKKRLVSADGLRWATNRNMKRPLPDRRYDIVEAWTLRERVNGKAVIHSTGMTEEAALKWIGGAA